MRTLLLMLALLAFPCAASAQTIGDALDLMQKTREAESLCPPESTSADNSPSTDHVYCRMTFRGIYTRSHNFAYETAKRNLDACATTGSENACAKMRAVKLPPELAAKLLDEQKKFVEAISKRKK